MDHNEEGRLAKKIKNFIYHPSDLIGSGFSSQVFKGISELEPDPALKSIAIKVIELAKIQNQVEKYLLNNQVNALKVLKHPNILKTIDILMTKNNVYIVTEFCEGGDLLKHIKEQGPINQVLSLELISQILQGYALVEEKGIIHRDLKTSNIFLSKGHAKIADFGFCEFQGQKKPQIAYNVGSPAYMSPQSYRQNQYSAKSDIWAIGVILHEFLTGQTPYRNLTYSQMVNNLTTGKIQGIKNQQIKRILIKCFKKDVTERIDTQTFFQTVKTELQRIKNNHQMHNRGRTNSNPPRHMLPPQAPSHHFSQVAGGGGQPQPPRGISPVKLKQQNRNQHNNPQHRVSQVSIPQQKSKNTGGAANYYQNTNIKPHTQTLLFLYRLLKFIVDIKWQKISSILLIIFRHRNMIDLLVQKSGCKGQQQPYKQFQYLKSRFDEVYLQHARQVPSNKLYRSQLQHYANFSFSDPQALELYRKILGQACVECELLLDSKNGNINYNQMGIILDYLMIEYEILGLHLDSHSFQDVCATANMQKIVREQPKKLTNAHLQLLKIKSKIIFGSPTSFTRHSTLN